MTKKPSQGYLINRVIYFNYQFKENMLASCMKGSHLMTLRKLISTLVLISFFNSIMISSVMASPNQNAKPTIAILNFQSNTGDASIDAMLSTGAAETIISDLSMIQEIIVVERTRIVEVMQEIELGMTGIIDDKTAQQAGKLIGVQYILMGHWQKFGDQFRVNARLVEVETGNIVVSIKETGNENRVFDLQDSISEQILANLQITISESDKAKIHKRETVSIEAYQEFSKGLMEYDKGNLTATNYHMQKSLEYDPDYAKPKEYIWISAGAKPGRLEKAIGFDQAKSKGGFVLKQVVIGAISLGGVAYLATSVGENQPKTDAEKNTRNMIVLGCATFGGLTGLVIGLSSKKVEKK
jgi:TolB-like protein